MRNFKNNRRRFRSNSFDRSLKINPNDQNLNSNLGNISDFRKKSFPKNNINSSKLIQKYSDLAREALSIGDKILYENYMQHAEHFIRKSENFERNSNTKNKSTQINLSATINTVDKKEDVNSGEELQIDKN